MISTALHQTVHQQCHLAASGHSWPSSSVKSPACHRQNIPQLRCSKVCSSPWGWGTQRRQEPPHRARRQCQCSVQGDQQELPAAVLFDCDGVLVDTEAQGHRVSFNKAFRQKGKVLCKLVVLTVWLSQAQPHRTACCTAARHTHMACRPPDRVVPGAVWRAAAYRRGQGANDSLL